jgi:hypothetical protein
MKGFRGRGHPEAAVRVGRELGVLRQVFDSGRMVHHVSSCRGRGHPEAAVRVGRELGVLRQVLDSGLMAH